MLRAYSGRRRGYSGLWLSVLRPLFLIDLENDGCVVVTSTVVDGFDCGGALRAKTPHMAVVDHAAAAAWLDDNKGRPASLVHHVSLHSY
ncbi:hypothetical protein AKJ16_DCAP07294 [Drosera capensis]